MEHCLGVKRKGKSTFFSFVNKDRKNCNLILYPKGRGKIRKIPMESAGTSLYSVEVKDLVIEDYNYAYEMDGKIVLDPYATKIVGREKWGEYRKKEVKCGFNTLKKYNWKQDKLPEILKQDMVMYKLHVRGFSMGQNLSSEDKGTFRGIREQLNYFTELGITTLEFMPVYEFEEVFCCDTFQEVIFPKEKINYWGYTRGNYFAPKVSYLGVGRDENELKDLIREMHQMNLECILEFYFDDKLNPHYIIDVLRYWAEEYHVDGFHVLCNAQIAEVIGADYFLSGRKLFFDCFSDETCEKEIQEMKLFSYNDGFLYSVRKLMNHYGGSVLEFANNMRRQHKNQGFVNYLANHNGFTLYDSFSYLEKYNQANGEENRDGICNNYSSNCGEEGITNNPVVNSLRKRQIMNGFCALMFAQGVPLIWMGDEDGNSQLGNNNPYCQDNEIGWKNWETTEEKMEIFRFLQQLIQIRKKYPSLRNPEPMRFTDDQGMGYPDLSYHGKEGWYWNEKWDEKIIGMMYSSRRNDVGEKIKDDYIYVGYNFSINPQELALPSLPENYRWSYVMNTGEKECFQKQMVETHIRQIKMYPQSVCLLVGKQEVS